YECARHRHDGNGIERAKALGAAILYGAGFARVSRAAPRFDVVLADSAFVRRSVEEGTDVRVRDVVYEAVDADARRVAREPAEEPLALFAGRISAEKGIFVLLEAFARARRLVPQARLHIAGSGPRLVDAKEAARRLGVGRAVEFLGRVPNERLPALYARAWCVAVPSTWPEPFGIVAAEAALCGAPVLASRIGGLPEALAVEDAADPAPHALVPPGDVAAWADALVAALQQPGSVPAAAREAVAARVGRREVARRLVRAYGARTVANA
ncbi:MAG TPA: glycosyltransferase, partial [Candidatus Thermoplasmatota archaeon]|nr:glycosyltransferase [Candidatus Thermoplasmatota archaeon]